MVNGNNDKPSVKQQRDARRQEKVAALKKQQERARRNRLIGIVTGSVAGLAVIGLGGGRTRPDDAIDHRTGFSAIRPLGSKVLKGEPMAMVHAASEDAANRAIADYLATVTLADSAPVMPPAIIETVS